MSLAEVDRRPRLVRDDRGSGARGWPLPSRRRHELRRDRPVGSPVSWPRDEKVTPSDKSGAPCKSDEPCGHERDGAEKWVLLAAAAFSCFAVLLVGLVGSAGAVPAEPAGATVVQVHQGDTLRGLADEFAPRSDERQVMRRIVELNDLDGGRLVPGPVVVPTDHL